MSKLRESHGWAYLMPWNIHELWSQTESCFGGMGYTYFLFAFIKKCMANNYAAGQKKDANHVQKESSLIGLAGGKGVLSLCHMPSSVKTQPQWIRRKQRPKMQYACEKWTYKRYKYSTHTQILYTHTHSMYPCMCATKNQKNFKHWIFLFFLHFTFGFVLFWAPRLRFEGGRSNMKLKLLSEFMCADRQRIKIIFIIKCEPQIISVSSGIFTWIVVVSVQLIEFLAFISYVNLSDPKVCREDRTVCD